MDAIDLTKYGYTPELAEDFKRRTIGKIIVSTFFKPWMSYKSKVEKLMDHIEEKVQTDWFDFAFMEKKSNVIVLNFVKMINGRRDYTPISFNDNCLREERFTEIITMIEKVKEIIHGS